MIQSLQSMHRTLSMSSLTRGAETKIYHGSLKSLRSGTAEIEAKMALLSMKYWKAGVCWRYRVKVLAFGFIRSLDFR